MANFLKASYLVLIKILLFAKKKVRASKPVRVTVIKKSLKYL